jgi:hypothetical protein
MFVIAASIAPGSASRPLPAGTSRITSDLSRARPRQVSRAPGSANWPTDLALLDHRFHRRHHTGVVEFDPLVDLALLDAA